MRLSLLILMCLPALMGQVVPRSSSLFCRVGPVEPGVPIGPDGRPLNLPPFFSFTAPLDVVTAEVGDVVRISWLDGDLDDNALITLLLDPDRDEELDFNSGNEVVILPAVMEDDDGMLTCTISTRRFCSRAAIESSPGYVTV